MSEANRELISRLYVALDRKDGETMARCYHPQASFRDPVFTLEGESVGDMWRMLTARASDLRAESHEVVADADSGSCRWEARYTFSGTGRAVHNRIQARFRFREGLIIEHVDQFDLWRWAAQALGPVGKLLGWSPMVRGKIRRQAAANLAAFQARRRAAG